MEQGNGSLRYKVYEVIAGGLNKLPIPGAIYRSGFDTLDDAIEYVMNYQHKRIEAARKRYWIPQKKQIVIQEYSGNYIARIVKIIEL